MTWKGKSKFPRKASPFRICAAQGHKRGTGKFESCVMQLKPRFNGRVSRK